ncbi:hypothetical protein M378DRAFT_67093 [Amanita muscaria Koide BX008]|uniref:COP9 signalosome complex subunit 6 n=1 Tax=Amanita muscaria (strain Koide BX008) TaxID=946122 RepID=A0A0C2XP90_AMAMK|nr:hypothetical protein M378DRAFT_67093 [Amanita muscaria Koide BX008]
MSAMDTDETSVVLSSNTVSGLNVSLHPLPILNISEHLTRVRLQTNSSNPFLLGALLGIQNGREVEIVNTFELAIESDSVDHGYLVSRRDQYKQVFPSLEFIGWYTVASYPTTKHIAIHEQFTGYCTTPLLVVLQAGVALGSRSSLNAQPLPFKAYEPSIEIRDRTTRAVYMEVPYTVETGEAERIAVDWTAKGGGSSTSLETHLQTQRSAVKMLHDRLVVLVKYVTDVIAGQAPTDHTILRSLAALVASLPATESEAFREEFHTEYEDVQLTAVLSSLTKSTTILNDLVDKHIVLSSRDERSSTGIRRKLGKPGFQGDWDR